MRRAAKVDGNHSEIVKHLRQLGMSVADTSRLGGGFPDLVVSWRMVTILVEVKDPKQPPSKRRLTEDEQRFHSGWKGQIAVVENAAEVEAIMHRLTIPR